MFAAEGFSRRILIGASATLAGASAMLFGVSVRAATDPVVQSLASNFRGTTTAGIHSFRGIRYGRATRFQPPVAEANPGRSIAATAFGPIAPQAGNRDLPQSEDCLFLNIWTPSLQSAARRPVMVYIHGGAYSNGTSTDPLNDGGGLAALNVVVVTVNHRLNAFGYLYLARLDPRFADSGNTGQLELILGLEWVRANIAAFGGDPGNVTVFGQSGGGAKIATLMGTPPPRACSTAPSP